MTKSTLSRRDLATMAVGAAAAATLAASPAEAAQPNMEKALAHLQAALKALKAANNNKGGHRIKAIEYTEAAIQRTKLGISYAS